MTIMFLFFFYSVPVPKGDWYFWWAYWDLSIDKLSSWIGISIEDHPTMIIEDLRIEDLADQDKIELLLHNPNNQ